MSMKNYIKWKNLQFFGILYNFVYLAKICNNRVNDWNFHTAAIFIRSELADPLSMLGKKIRHRAHRNLSRVLEEKGRDDRPCRRATTRRTSVSQVGAVGWSRRRDVRSHATGHYRIKYRQAAFSDGESRARNREKNARIHSGFSRSLSLPLSIFRSLSPWSFRRFVCAAIGASTHTCCAHNRLREAKPL